MADKEPEVATSTLEDSTHIVNLLKIVAMCASTPALGALGGEALNELRELNVGAAERMAEFNKAVAAAEAKKAADKKAAEDAAVKSAPKEKVA